MKNFRKHKGILVFLAGLGMGAVLSTLLYAATQRIFENGARQQFRHQASITQLAIETRIAYLAFLPIF